ncbi:MAG TPA: glycosyltransferase family 39 protein [Solirubrobacter sp.]|nr:glycosyltransferase family 39 protein [Solirubrobacter sp.]
MTATIHDGVRVGSRRRARAVSLPRPELAALLVLAGVLNLWALSRNGWANEYYAGAVRSMASSWHAFLYGSLDAGGVMTVDKPPLALWVQALSVRAFGWSSWSILVPQALMGAASVWLVYDLVARRFGRAGGFVAGAVLAFTPIAVAVSRHNNPDALLVLCVIAALWAIVRGLEDGRVRWMVLAGVFVGLGFETKMGAALLVAPALVVAWAWAAPRARVRGVVGFVAALVVVGGAWPLLVALTPAASRPWISGTSDNSIWSLILNYNGLGRLDGQAGGPGGFGGGGGTFGGSPGVLRLLNSALGGQAGWLLGFALVAGLGLVAASRLSRRDPVTGWVLAVGGSALTIAVAFSKASGIFHPYYVSELAPFSAALVGAGAVRFTRGDGVARVFGPLAIAGGVITELIVLGNSDTLPWVAPLIVVGGVLAAGALAFAPEARWRNAALATALATLLIAPATWSIQTLGHATNGTFPAGGPANAGMGFGGPGGGRGRFAGGGGPGGGGFTPGAGSSSGGGTVPGAGGSSSGGFVPGAGSSSGGGTVPGAGSSSGGSSSSGGGFGPGGSSSRGGFGGPGGGGIFGGDSASLQTALAYIKANGGGTLAVSSQSTAAAAIINSDADVAGIGGFSGRESEVSVQWLAQQVAAGKIRWVLADGSGGGLFNDGRAGASVAMAAVEATCKPVDVDGVTLYDCQGAASALAAYVS